MVEAGLRFATVPIVALTAWLCLSATTELCAPHNRRLPTDDRERAAPRFPTDDPDTGAPAGCKAGY